MIHYKDNKQVSVMESEVGKNLLQSVGSKYFGFTGHVIPLELQFLLSWQRAVKAYAISISLESHNLYTHTHQKICVQAVHVP